jgi:hypothetical protein
MVLITHENKEHHVHELQAPNNDERNLKIILDTSFISRFSNNYKAYKKRNLFTLFFQILSQK